MIPRFARDNLIAAIGETLSINRPIRQMAQMSEATRINGLKKRAR